jgi:feruloyl esterase
MLLLLLLATTPFLAAAAAAGVPCSVLNPGLELGAGGLFTATNATVIAAGAPINFTNAAYNITTAGVLPAFCRVQLTVHTNPAANASAHAEVWLPEPSAWNGRVLGTGNGGLSGGVQMGDLGDNGIMLGFAAFGTDTGHQSDTNGASWAVGNPVSALSSTFSGLVLTRQT